MKKKVLIGIDPDVDKSGVAIINGLNIGLMNLTFFKLYDFLKNISEDYSKQMYSIMVYIEAGWLNKSNWHKLPKGSAAVNAKIGSYVGANFETGKKIVEMCEYLGLNYKLVKPTKSKIKAASFKNITKITQRTNQEQRDAFMLIFGRK